LKRTIAAIAGSVLLVCLTTAAAFAWGSRIEGRPQAFDAGGTSGVYFWHESDDGLHLRTTDPNPVDHLFTGTITTDGNFHDLDLIRLEQDDTATIDPTGHMLTFSFNTYAGVDGLDYYIDGGTWQTLSLKIDGRQLSPARIFLGEDSVHPDHDPFTALRNP
jgi:hypothetical protein